MRVLALSVLALLFATGCPVGPPAEAGGVSGTLVRDGESLDVRLFNANTTHGIGTLQAYGTVNPAARHNRSIDVRFDLATMSLQPTMDVPLQVGTLNSSTCGGDNCVVTRYVEIDPDQPDGQGLVFPTALDQYTVTGMVVLHGDGVAAHGFTGEMDLIFTSGTSVRHIVGSFAIDRALSADGGGVFDVQSVDASFDSGMDVSSDAPRTDAATDVTHADALPDAPPLASCASSGVPRDCGLQYEGMVRHCTAGTMVSVACHAGCMGLGYCIGDSVIQICPGTSTTTPCLHTAAIAYNDDASGCMASSMPVSQSNCSQAQFMCPAGGTYTVWFGSYSATRPAMACVIGVR